MVFVVLLLLMLLLLLVEGFMVTWLCLIAVFLTGMPLYILYIYVYI